MVYRGKPSAACAWCRGRRLKVYPIHPVILRKLNPLQCDQKRPSCSSCVRAKQSCAYRDLAALSFHDQTAEVVERARRRPQPHSENAGASFAATSPEHAYASDNGYSTAMNSDTNALAVQPISAPTADQGIAYVLTYHLGSAYRSVSGHLSSLPSLLQQEASPAVMASINAMGLAALGNIHNSPHLIREARQQYTIALSETNSALQGTVTAQSDATLAAVLILGLYEVSIEANIRGLRYLLLIMVA